jgi:single-strand DNA-binding protein
MNKVILIGNLTRDPELATTNSGVSVCRFSIAVQRRFQNAEGEREADFFNIVVWRAQAENCHKFLKKGSKCAVTGRLQNSSYEANDGSKRYTTEIVADEVEFLGAKPEGAGDAMPKASAPKKATTELVPIDDDDSLPF